MTFNNKLVAEALCKVLADTFLLYLKTHNFHWNVTGDEFVSLHKLFNDQYDELWSAVDLIAEHIRALDQPAPGSCQEFLAEGSITEAKGELKTPSAMISALIADNQKVCATIQFAMERSDRLKDVVITNLLIDRLDAHSKAIWMLKSLAKGGS